MYYKMQPGASWSLLKMMLQGAGSLSDAEIQFAYDGLLNQTSKTAVGHTVMIIAGTWAPAKQMAVFGHIAEIAYATAKTAYGTAYGTGVALPMFIKMTAAEFLGWDGATKKDPIGNVNVGFNLVKPSMPEDKKGPTVVRTGEKWGAKFARWVVQDNGVLPPLQDLQQARIRGRYAIRQRLEFSELAYVGSDLGIRFSYWQCGSDL